MLNVLKYRVATARWYIFFCALVEEKYIPSASDVAD